MSAATLKAVGFTKSYAIGALDNTAMTALYALCVSYLEAAGFDVEEVTDIDCPWMETTGASGYSIMPKWEPTIAADRPKWGLVDDRSGSGWIMLVAWDGVDMKTALGVPEVGDITFTVTELLGADILALSATNAITFRFYANGATGVVWFAIDYIDSNALKHRQATAMLTTLTRSLSDLGTDIVARYGVLNMGGGDWGFKSVWGRSPGDSGDTIQPLECQLFTPWDGTAGHRDNHMRPPTAVGQTIANQLLPMYPFNSSSAFLYPAILGQVEHAYYGMGNWADGDLFGACLAYYDSLGESYGQVAGEVALRFPGQFWPIPSGGLTVET